MIALTARLSSEPESAPTISNWPTRSGMLIPANTDAARPAAVELRDGVGFGAGLGRVEPAVGPPVRPVPLAVGVAVPARLGGAGGDGRTVVVQPARPPAVASAASAASTP
ncbi:MAG TPA: hypothetical protein VK816_06260 [Jatrophihabitantaceae bacterium]|nr:hypothetical protein [Jatrophihabitantaceae bacterium]